MAKTTITLVMYLVALLVFTGIQLYSSQVLAAEKVVVIPLNMSKAAAAPTCTVRESAYENLDTWYKDISVSCQAGETVMGGGFANGNYNTSSNCRVVKSRPFDNGWQVTWGMPTETECAAHEAKTYAICCAW